MSLPTPYFDAMYAAADDPWGFTERWYEQRKYALTLAALPQRRYRNAYEPGCSIGVLTSLLADRCDALLASDASAAAVDRARRRLAGHAGVEVEQRRLPEEWPGGAFDLVVLSELLYYFDAADLSVVLEHALGSVAPGGTLVAVHWRHPVEDYPRTGDDVHAQLSAAATSQSCVRVAAHAEADFLLDVWFRPQPGDDAGRSSVAAMTGLV